MGTSEGKNRQGKGKSLMTWREFLKTKAVSFQPEGAHGALSTINEKRPSPPRNVLTTFQNTEDKEKNEESERKGKVSPTRGRASEGVRLFSICTGSQRTRHQPSPLWGSQTSRRDFHTQPDCQLNTNVTFSDSK